MSPMTTRDLEVNVHEVEYQRPGGRPLLARIYRPPGTGPFPMVLDVHGGAWNSGSRLNNETMNRDLAATGLVVVAVDFRHPPSSRYPDSIADVNLATRWLKAHAAEFNGRADRVGGFGTSSGGHMVMLSAMRPSDPRYAALELAEGADVDARLDCVVVCWPILDPLARYHFAQAAGRKELVANHDAYWQTEEAMAEGNPQMILERGERVELPPALIVQGTADANVTPDMADRFANAYRRAGGSAELRTYEGMPHIFILNRPEAPESAHALEAIKAFMRRHLE